MTCFILIMYRRRYIHIRLQLACFVWKPEHFAWHKATVDFVEKYVLISWLWAFLELRALRKVLKWMLVSLVLTTRRLNSQSKFQMFTLYSGRHIAAHGCSRTWRFLTGPCKFLGNIYDKYLKFLIVKIARGKKPPVSLLANTFMGRQICWINPENALQRG